MKKHKIKVVNKLTKKVLHEVVSDTKTPRSLAEKVEKPFRNKHVTVEIEEVCNV
jgi:hypothetical protein